MRRDKKHKMKRLRTRKQALPRTVQKEPISRQAEPDDRATLERESTRTRSVERHEPAAKVFLRRRRTEPR